MIVKKIMIKTKCAFSKKLQNTFYTSFDFWVSGRFISLCRVYTLRLWRSGTKLLLLC